MAGGRKKWARSRSHIAANIYGIHEGKRNIKEALGLIEKWRRGLKIKADTYPITYGRQRKIDYL